MKSHLHTFCKLTWMLSGCVCCTNSGSNVPRCLSKLAFSTFTNWRHASTAIFLINRLSFCSHCVQKLNNVSLSVFARRLSSDSMTSLVRFRHFFISSFTRRLASGTKKNPLSFSTRSCRNRNSSWKNQTLQRQNIGFFVPPWPVNLVLSFFFF